MPTIPQYDSPPPVLPIACGVGTPLWRPSATRGQA